MTWLEKSYFGNSIETWLIAAAIAVAVLAGIFVFKRIVIRRLGVLAERTGTRLGKRIAEALYASKVLLLLPLAAYIGARYLELPERVDLIVSRVTVVALLMQAALWANRFIVVWLNDTVQEKRQTDAASATTLGVLGFVARLAVWSLVLLLALDNLGFNITALLAGMGIGGIAVALAAQNILGDLFASLSIVLDKPFVVGDFIIVGEQLGTVEYIGLKTTRIRSLGGEQIVFSNTDLLGSRIRNYKRMQERRVVFGFGVVYQTPHDKLQRIPAMVRDIIEKIDRTRFDRAHFKEYGDSSLNFEVVYHVLSADFNVHMDIQQAINLALFRRFQQDGIDFAYPTRTLYVVGQPAAGGGPER
jgi:small-conductance mechanosensitive channel